MLLLAVLLGVWVERARRQQRAVRILREFGFHAGFSYQHDAASGRYLKGIEPPVPKWLVNLLGENFFFSIVVLDARGIHQFSDGQAEYVKDLPHLRWLVCHRSSHLTDDGLAKLAGLRRLEVLNVGGCSISDDGISQLASLKQLKVLELPHVQVTEASLETFTRLPNLELLQLTSSNLTPAAVEALKRQLPNCAVTWRPRRCTYEDWTADRAASEYERDRIARLGRDLVNKRRDIELRCVDAEDLGYWGHHTCIVPLTHVLADDSEDLQVRRACMFAISSIAERNVVPLLIEMLDDPQLGYTTARRLKLVTHAASMKVPNPAADVTELRQIQAEWREWWQAFGDIVVIDRALVCTKQEWEFRAARVGTNAPAEAASGVAHDEMKTPPDLAKTASQRPKPNDTQSANPLPTASKGAPASLEQPEPKAKQFFDLSGNEVDDQVLLDEEGLDAATRIDLDGSKISDAALRCLTQCKSLRTLHLADTGIGDDGVSHLAGLTELRMLTLSYTGISNDGLESLSGLVHLEHLDLIGTRISDDGLKHLRGLNRLKGLGVALTGITDDGLQHLRPYARFEELTLDETYITDRGLRELRSADNLKLLSLTYTDISDRSLAHLSGLNSLTYLYLGGTGVTDEGMVHLKDLRSLIHLAVSDTAVSDAGVDTLLQFKNLKYLYIDGTKMSHEGIKKLKTARPELSVVD